MITTETTLWCDTEGCEKWVASNSTDFRLVRSMYQVEGWRRVKADNKFKDLCPDCAAKREARK